MAMSSMQRNDGMAVPIDVHSAPRVLRSLYPMNVLRLMAKTPGQLWEMAMRSIISSLVTQPRRATTSCSMSGIMA